MTGRKKLYFLPVISGSQYPIAKYLREKKIVSVLSMYTPFTLFSVHKQFSLSFDTALIPHQVLQIIYRWSRQKNRLYANVIPFYTRHEVPCGYPLAPMYKLSISARTVVGFTSWQTFSESSVWSVLLPNLLPPFWGSRDCKRFQKYNACPNKCRPLDPSQTLHTCF